MNEGPTAEDIELLLSTPEGRKALEELQRMQNIPDSIDEVGYDPDILRPPAQIGASPDNPGATRGQPQGFSPYQDPLDTDQSMTLEEKKRRRMLAQLMANQQTRIS
tara:strand:- start:661 stop:978 length:318 start_codon:yes stop_codon:yes gene_type:complete